MKNYFKFRLHQNMAPPLLSRDKWIKTEQNKTNIPALVRTWITAFKPV